GPHRSASLARSSAAPPCGARSPLLQLVDVAQDATGHANGQDGQVAPGLVLDAAGHVDDDAGVQLDLLVVQEHRPPAGDDVVELVGALVVVQLGVLDLDVVDLAGGVVLLLDEAADLAAGLRPGPDLRRVAPQEPGSRAHGVSSRAARQG